MCGERWLERKKPKEKANNREKYHMYDEIARGERSIKRL